MCCVVYKNVFEMDEKNLIDRLEPAIFQKNIS